MEGWTPRLIVIAVVMVVTGSLNTLAAKWADKMESVGIDGNKRQFDHPFVQAICMFIGEFMCLFVFIVSFLIGRYKYKKSTVFQDLGPGEAGSEICPEFPKFNPLLLWPAALCDMCATSIMYVGLNLTGAASFQMLRGSCIIFTGLLSVAFLRRVLHAFKWIGMLFVLFGLVIVGLADVVGQNMDDFNSVISGDLLIIMAQIIVSVQMVYEERVLTKYNAPALYIVGLEGFFGMTTLTLLCIPMYYIHVPKILSDLPHQRLEDALDAFTQIGNNHLIIVALVGTILSISFFNFAGMSVTKGISATTRMVLDSVRTFVIWAVSLAIGWQDFRAIQVFGFLLLSIGMFIYNDAFIGPTNIRKLGDRFTPIRRLLGWCYMVPNENVNSDRDILVNNDQLQRDV